MPFKPWVDKRSMSVILGVQVRMGNKPSVLQRFFLGLMGLILSSCDWMGKAPPPPLPGERVPVMVYEHSFKTDPELEQLNPDIPAAVVNEDWPQSGGNAQHLMPPLELSLTPQKIWSRSIGRGSSRRNKLIVEPIVAKNHVYTMDTNYLVSCFDFEDGDRVWEADVSHHDWAGVSLGGGLAYEDDQIFVTTANGEVIALNFETGQEIWRTSVMYPVRAAPTVAQGKVFVLTLNNTLDVLDSKTGEKIWSHAGATEIAGILGSASPAVSQGIVVVPYSSGEIVALKIETGESLWADNLVSMRKSEGLTGLAHIRACPVIDGDQVYAISHSGRMVALNLETGDRLWDQEIGGLYAPAVVGNFLFVLSSTGELLCLEKNSGKTKWVQDLSSYVKKGLEEDSSSSSKEMLHWVGPLLTDNTLIAINSNHRRIFQISPQTGDVMGEIDSKEKVLIPPIIAKKTLIFVTDDGYVMSFR